MSMPTRQEVHDHIRSEAGILSWFVTGPGGAGGDDTADTEPASVEFTDLDSFSVVQLILSLEEAHGVELLEALSDFSGQSFDDLTDFAMERIRAQAQDPASSSG